MIMIMSSLVVLLPGRPSVRPSDRSLCDERLLSLPSHSLQKWQLSCFNCCCGCTCQLNVCVCVVVIMLLLLLFLLLLLVLSVPLVWAPVDYVCNVAQRSS